MERKILESLVAAPGGTRELDMRASPPRSLRGVGRLESEGLVVVDDSRANTLVVSITDAGRAVLQAPRTKVGPAPADSPRRGGSNVDLPDAAEIDADLTRWSHAIDDVMAIARTSFDEVPILENNLEKAWAKAYVEALSETEAISGRENYARVHTQDEKLALDVAKAVKARCIVELENRRAQLSAAQSRVKLYVTQMNVDTKGTD